jgi:hypothetical protein
LLKKKQKKKQKKKKRICITSVTNGHTQYDNHQTDHVSLLPQPIDPHLQQIQHSLQKALHSQTLNVAALDGKKHKITNN